MKKEEITKEKLEDAIYRLKMGNASGDDKVTTVIIKNVNEDVLSFLFK